MRCSAWQRDTVRRSRSCCRNDAVGITRGYDHKTAELMARRRRVSGEARRGDAGAQAELAVVREEQRRLVAEKRRALASLDGEPSQIEPGETTMIAHALVVPTHDPEERQRHDADVEAIAMDLARAHEEAAGAAVRDVSRPPLARREGLGDWPGFDLRSLRPAGAHGPAEDRAVEVKGRAETRRRRGERERVGGGLQPAGPLLALRRLRLRHPPAAPSQGPRPVRPTPGHGEGERRHRRIRNTGGECG